MKVIKSYSMELLYNIVDERTASILEKQERDKQKLLSYFHRLEEKQERDKQELKAEIRHLNQKFDNMINLFVSLLTQKNKEK